MKQFIFILLMLFASMGYSETSSYCETETFHLNITAETASAIKLTITNVDATSMYVEIESTNGDPVDDLLVNNGSGATISAKDESVAGKIRRTLTWATPPTDVSIELLWSKVSMGGMWMLNTFSVPFAATCAAPPAGTVATLSDLKVDGTTITGFSASKLSYTVGLAAGTTIVPTITVTTTDASATKVITAAGTLPGTTNVVVTALDGTTTKTYTVAFIFTSPSTAAATPPVRAAGDVISIFSGAYTDVTGTNFNPGWGQSTAQSTVDIAGNSTLKYANFNYQGTVLGSTQDASLMEYLHVDMWTSDATVVKVTPIGGGETLVALDPIVAGQWKSYDIPLTSFTAVNKAIISQLKFDGQAGVSPSNIYLDNIYFYKAAAAAGTDATLSDLKVSGTTITGFSASKLSYTVGLVQGTTAVPVVTVTTTDASATKVITAASAIPGTTSVVVTAQDGTTTKTYTIAFAITTPSAAAATPPAREDGDVISIFSGAYTNVAGTNFDAGWGEVTVQTIEDIAGNSTLKYANFNFQGTQLAGTIDASAMEYLHVDMWTADATSVKVTPIGGGEMLLPLTPIVAESWKSYDIPLTSFTGVTNKASIGQLKFENFGGDPKPTIYLDNIYFYKAAAAAGTDAGLSDLKVSGTTITGFSTNTLNYTVSLPKGTTVVPAVTCTATDAAATKVITAATAIPGTTTVVVTAQDGTTTKTYNVAFAIELALPFDFEGIPVTADFTNFDGAIATVLTNPQSSGINTSATVAKIVRSGGATWAGSKIKLASNLDFSVKGGISMKVFTTAPIGTTVKFKLEGTGSAELDAVTTKTNEWETLKWDFTGKPTNYNWVIFMFDFGHVGDGTAASTFLFDDVQQYEILLSNDATLNDLKVSGTTITGFNASTLSYNVKLPVGTTAIPAVTAFKNQAGATVLITQATALPGAATVLVTAEDASTKTYTINFSVLVPQVLPVTFEAAPYDISNFEGGALTVITNPHLVGNSSTKVGQLIKGAGSGAAGSYITLTNNIDFSVKPKISIKVYSPRVGATLLFKLEGSAGPTEKTATSTVANAWETFTFDFTGAASNVYNKMVFIFDLGTAGNGSANYTFLIDDIEQTGTIASTDATLSDLKVSATTITGFASATLAYSVELPFGTTAIPALTATKTNANANVVITPTGVLPGTTNIVVTAEDGITTKTYTVAFTIKAANTDATLSSLIVGGTAVTGFASATLAYTMELPFGTSTVPVVTSTANDVTATAVVTAATALPGTSTVVVTAQDGTTKKTYTINFTIAAPSSDANLSALLIDGLPLLDFASATLTYNAELPLGTTIIPTVTATLNDATATVVITQASALPGTATAVVTAQDGTTVKTYTISFTVALTLSTDATLRDLKVNGTSVSNFASATLNYTVELPYGTTLVPAVTGVRKNTAAAVVVNPAASLSQKTTVVVTAQDGTTILTYNVAFTIALPSNNAQLSSLLVNGKSVTDFSASKFDYSVILPVAATVPPTIAAIVNDANATFVITQATKLPDTATVVVRAQDGTTVKTYKVAFANAPLYKVTFTIVNHAQQALADAEVAFMLDTLTTDINGMVEFTQVSPTGDEIYSVSKTGYVDVSGTISVVDANVSKTETLEILTYSVKFAVVDINDSPLADAEVAFMLDTLTTDLNGMVEFTSVSPTTDAIYAVSKTGYVDATGTLSVVDADVSKTVTMELQTYAVKFTVVDINNIPIVDAEVAFILDTLTTDANGMAEFTSVLPTTDAMYSVTKSGYVIASGTISVIDADVELTVILEKVVYDVTFAVVDENDEAIADAQVVFNETIITTDANGIAIFASVPPGVDAPYTITKADYIDASGTLSVIDANVDIKVQMIAVGIKNNTVLVGNIYPNPTNGALTIQLAANVSEASLELYDLNGGMVLKTTLNKLETTLDLSGNKSGIYLLKVLTENKQYMEKVVISK